MGRNDASPVAWASGDSYERYVGRWSRLVAQEFVQWLALPQNKAWLDVGSGTGILSRTILAIANPQKLKGIDRSERFVDFASGQVTQSHVEFEVGDAQDLPVESEAFDAAVSGLVLNFVPQPQRMIAEMKRAVRRGGTVALYVWDYAGKMQFMRYFWNAAAALDATAKHLDEGRVSPICNPDLLTELFQNAGLSEIEMGPIDIWTEFRDFDDFWSPFLGGQGPAPSYTMSLSEEQRGRLRERLYNSLPFALDGSIPLVARAWAVKGIK
jgi:SAM-dependent methyltransferase